MILQSLFLHGDYFFSQSNAEIIHKLPRGMAMDAHIFSSSFPYKSGSELEFPSFLSARRHTKIHQNSLSVICEKSIAACACQSVRGPYSLRLHRPATHLNERTFSEAIPPPAFSGRLHNTEFAHDDPAGF